MQNLSKVSYRGSNIAKKKTLAGRQRKKNEKNKNEFYHKKPTLLDKTPIYFSLGTKQQETMTRQMSKLRIPQSHPLTERWSKAKVFSKAGFTLLDF